MHEYSLVLAMMERIDREAASRGAVAVHRVRLRIGELSGVEAVLLASAFDIVQVPARWECPQCRAEVAQGQILQCATCQVPARLAHGDEILLDQIEMEVP